MHETGFLLGQTGIRRYVDCQLPFGWASLLACGTCLLCTH